MPVRPDSEYDNQQPPAPPAQPVNLREAQERAENQAVEDWLVSPVGVRTREAYEEAAIKAQSDYVHSDQYSRDVDRYQEDWVKARIAQDSADAQAQMVEERQAAAEVVLPPREPFFVDAPGQEEYVARVSSGLPQPTVTGKQGAVDLILESGATQIGALGADIGALSQKAKKEGNNLSAGGLFIGAATIGAGAAVFDAVTFPARPKAWAETSAFGAMLVANPGEAAGAIVADFMTNPGFKLGYWGANVGMLAYSGAGIYKKIKGPKGGAVEVTGARIEKYGTKPVEGWKPKYSFADEKGLISPELQAKGMMTGSPDPLPRLTPDFEIGPQIDTFKITVDTKPFKGGIPRNALKNPDIIVGVLEDLGGEVRFEPKLTDLGGAEPSSTGGVLSRSVTLKKTAIVKGLDYGKIKAGKPFIADEVMFKTFEKPVTEKPTTTMKIIGYGDTGAISLLDDANIPRAGDLLGLKEGKLDITKAADYRVDFDVGTKMVEVPGAKVVKPAEWTVKMFDGEPGLIQSKPAVIDWNAKKGSVEVSTVTSKIVKASDLGVDVNAKVEPLMGDSFNLEIKGFAKSPPPEPSFSPFKQLIKKTSWDRTNVKAWRSEIPFTMEQAAKVGASKPPSMPVVGASGGGSGGAPMLSLTDVALDVSPIIITSPQPSLATSTFGGLGVVQAFKGHALAPVSEFPILDIKPPILDLGQPSRQKPTTYPKLTEQLKTRTPPEVKPPEFKPILDTPTYQEPKTWITQPPRIIVREKTEQLPEQIPVVIPAFKWSPPPTQARFAPGLPFPPGFGAGGFGRSTRYRKRIQRVPLPTMNDIMRRMKF